MPSSNLGGRGFIGSFFPASRSLPKLARLAAASPRNLARLFQAELGMSFTAWRQQARLMEALRPLSDGATDVALDLGHSTPSAFTYMFRWHLGAAPSRSFDAERKL